MSETLFYAIRNVGYIDRAIRLALGTAAIIITLATQNTGPLGWEAIIPLLAVYPILTGLVGYDVFYAWLQIDTSRSSVFSDAKVVDALNHMIPENTAVNSGSETDNQIAKKSSRDRDAA